MNKLIVGILSIGVLAMAGCYGNPDWADNTFYRSVNVDSYNHHAYPEHYWHNDGGRGGFDHPHYIHPEMGHPVGHAPEHSVGHAPAHATGHTTSHKH